MIELSDTQKATVANGVTVLSVSAVIAFVIFIGWVVMKALAFAAPALVPVLFGFFLALFFKPYYRWCKGVFKNPTVALIAMLITVFIPLGLLLWYAGSVIIDEISNLVAQGPELIRQVIVWFEVTFPKFHSLLVKLGLPSGGDWAKLYTNYGETALKAGTSALKCLTGIISALVTLIFFVFFLMTKDRRGGEIVGHLPFLKPQTRDFLASQIDAFIEILVSFFQRQAVICLIEGVYYGTGFWMVGLPYGFLIGFLLGVINLIPLFGTILCMPLAMPLAYFPHGGSTTRLLLVITVWFVGQLLDGYFITPRIQGNKTGLGYAGVIFSFFFWSTVMGPVLGMLLAIPLSAFCVVLWRAVKAKYIHPVV